MKIDAKKLTELLKKISVDVLGKPMSKQDETRFARQLRKAQKKTA